MKRKIFNVLFALVLVLSMSLVIAAPAAAAATINVPADYATIQAAITAATAGDTILVAAGTYVENVVIDKGMTLHGAAGAIIAPASGPGIQIDASPALTPVTVDGFTITPKVIL